MQLEPHYNNGKLDEIVLCKQNVPMVDLHRSADFCTHYVISNNKLSYILIEYSNVPMQELEGVIDRSMTKIDDYYFGNSDQYVFFKLMTIGDVVKVYRNLSMNPPPANILKQLDATRRGTNPNTLTGKSKVQKNIPNPLKLPDPRLVV